MDLHIAEIPYDDGTLKFRYSRYLSNDGSRWVRHGRFEAYHHNGQLASEGLYEHGAENGVWKEYHENGLIAATGTYINGKELSDWKYWDSNGVPE